MDAVSLSGPLLPAFRPLQDNGGDGCCLLVWVYTTSFQTLLDIGGDGCCLLVWAFTTCLQAFAGYWGRCILFSLSGSILPAFRPCWISGETSAVSLSGPLLPARGAYCRIMREKFAVSLSAHQSSQWLPRGSFI